MKTTASLVADLLNKPLPAATAQNLPGPVHNTHATQNCTLAVIGEAPSREEVFHGKPFVGASGRLLWGVLARYGFTPSNVFVGNVCQYRPPGDNILAVPWMGKEIQQSLANLKEDLAKANPNLVVLLGNYANKAARDCLNPNFKRYAYPVSNWRGSLFYCDDPASPFFQRKCMATYHPAAVLRNWPWIFELKKDFLRAQQEARTPDLVLPTYDVHIIRDIPALEAFVYKVHSTPNVRLSLDIEGYVDNIKCIGFAIETHKAVVVPLSKGYWNPSDEIVVWRLLSSIISDPAIPKVLQNSLYDNFVLSYSYHCPIRGIEDDTMLKHWELLCETEKSLAFQTSIYTRTPYYKFEGKMGNEHMLYTYCGKDAAVTYEINNVLDANLQDELSRQHYKFNVDCLSPLLYMEVRGIRFNSKLARRRALRLQCKAAELQRNIDLYAAKAVGKAGFTLNVESPKQMAQFLYNTLKLPVQLHKKTKSPTTDASALRMLFLKTQDPIINSILELRELNTRISMLQTRTDSDGRIRCAYNAVGTDTGRLTCYTSPTGSGFNLQTVPSHDRDLLRADHKCYIFSCDLSGADGWTVAAHAADCGDPTMLDDLLFGLKIPLILATSVKKGSAYVASLTREELKEAVKEIDKKGSLYFACKCVQHGSNYGMHETTIVATVFDRSGGTVRISVKEARLMQQMYFNRYPGIPRWHSKCQQLLLTQGKLRSASGNLRIFLDRREASSTLRQFLASEAQNNTTYATNCAMLRLWNDPENRKDGRLVAEPLHQVHDAIVGQFKRESLDFMKEKLPSWFHNPIVIAKRTILIPYEGYYSTSWGGPVLGKL